MLSLAKQIMSIVWGIVQAAHLSAQSCDSLVHHSCVEEVDVRKRSSDKAHMTKLRVRSIVARAQCLLRLTVRLIVLRLFLACSSLVISVSGKADVL